MGDDQDRDADGQQFHQSHRGPDLPDAEEIRDGPNHQDRERPWRCGPDEKGGYAGRGRVPILRKASASGVAGSQSTTWATRCSCAIRFVRSIVKIRCAVPCSDPLFASRHSIARGEGETIATSVPRAASAMIAPSADGSCSGEMSTTRQSRGKNRESTQATWANGHSPPGRTWVRWSRIRYSCFRPNAGGTQSRTSRCTIRPTRFFDARTCSAIARAARTPCSIGLSSSVPMNDSVRASTTITTSPERSPSYSFEYRRSNRADAFQLIRRTSSPGTYSRIPQKSVPTPIRREGTWPNHGRVRRGWRRTRRRSSMAGATTSRESTRTTASSAPRASGSSDRARTGPRWKSPLTADRTVYDKGTSPPFSNDTTAWFVPRTTASSRGRTSTISTRSRAGPSLRTTSSIWTSHPACTRSRDRDRTARTCGVSGGNSDPSARKITGGRERRTVCQLRNARPRTRNARDVAARPLDSEVRISRHLGDGDLAEDVRDHARRADAANPRIRLEDEAVGEGRERDGLHVVRRHEVPSGEGRSGPRDLQEREGTARARADLDLVVLPRPRDDVDDVSLDRWVHVDVLEGRLEREHLVRRRDGFNRGIVGSPRASTLQDLDLLLPRRIADVNFEEEPVHLRLREGVRAFVLDRVLRRHDEERAVEAERLALQGRLPLLHRLEERGLRLRRCAVDLVRKEDVREQGPAAQDELPRLALEDVRARDVRGQEVRCELHATEREPEARREGLRDERLREPRHVLDEQVSVAEERPEDPLEHPALPDDDRLDRIEERGSDLRDGGDLHFHASMRFRTSSNFRAKPPRSRASTTQRSGASRSPTSRCTKSSITPSRNIRRNAAGSRCTARIDSGDTPVASLAFPRNAFRARDATRTWLYARPRLARRVAAARIARSPSRYAPSVAGPTSGAGSALRRRMRAHARAANAVRNPTPRNHWTEPLNCAR